jgi:hypothetical protein
MGERDHRERLGEFETEALTPASYCGGPASQVLSKRLFIGITDSSLIHRVVLVISTEFGCKVDGVQFGEGGRITVCAATYQAIRVSYICSKAVVWARLNETPQNRLLFLDESA